MCNCPKHQDFDAECRCQCDHEVEDAIEYVATQVWDFLTDLDPAVVKALAAGIRARAARMSDPSATVRP